jgi:hypothetical protein
MIHPHLPQPLWIAGTPHPVADDPHPPMTICGHRYTLLIGTEWRHVCDDQWMAPALPAWPLAEDAVA